MLSLFVVDAYLVWRGVHHVGAIPIVERAVHQTSIGGAEGT
jgi:hypothetical protein